VFLQRHALEIFLDGLVRGWFAGQNEMAAGLLDGFGNGLAGEQVVAEINWP